MSAVEQTDVSTLSTLDRVYSPNFGGHLTVVGLGFGFLEAGDVVSGIAPPIEARLSSDGRSWVSAWHEGPETGDPVYVERLDETGVVFHGYVDSASRRIVQAG